MPGLMIKAVRIPSRKIKDPKIRQRLKRVMDEERQEILKLLNMTIQAWDGERPTMIGTVKELANRLELHAYPGGSEKGRKKWWWLEEGTSVRYAQLSRDWRSKTQPGDIKSRPGRGRVLRRGKKAGAHPGIEVRGWRKIILRMRYRQFVNKVRSVVGRGVFTR